MYRICLVLILVFVLNTQTGMAQNMSFDILNGEERVSIPFTYRHNFLVVEVRLFGMLPLSFIFDTGAENTMLFTREFADFVGVKYDLRIPILGSDMSQRIYALVARSVDIEINGLPSVKRDILVLEDNDINLAEITGVPIHGILGGSFFKNTVVEIDYRKQRIVFHKPETFIPPKGDSYHKIPITIEQDKPYVNVRARLTNNDTVNLKLLIDTGAGLPLLLHNNSHPSLVLPEQYILGRLGVGLGGYIEGYVGRVAELDLGGIKFDQVLTSFHDLGSTIMESSDVPRNGLIGNRILLRTRVIIDYLGEVMYIKPRFGYSRRFKMDRSGLIIVATGFNLDEFLIRDVMDRSPAADAGLQAGDLIVKFQGLRASGFELDQINSILQKKEGKRIRIIIDRDGERLKFEFRLRQLI